MDPKSKSSIFKTKSSNKGKVNKSNNSKENVQPAVKKFILKRRGLYVEKNAVQKKLDDVNELQLKNQRNSSASTSSQNKFVSSVITTSIVGNRKLVTHEFIKPKRKRFKVKKPQAKKEFETETNENKMDDTKCNKKMNPKVLNTKEKHDDNIVFVLKSRNLMEESATNSDSNRSKRNLDWSDSISEVNVGGNVKQMLSKSICSGIDKVATEALQGQKIRKEKEKKLNDTNEPKTLVSEDKVDKELYNLCVDILQTTMSGSDIKVNHEIPSSCKLKETTPRNLPETTKRITFKEFDDTNISEMDNNTPEKFYIMENNNADQVFSALPMERSFFARTQNFKTESLVYPKIKKQSMRHTQSFNENKRIKKGSKKRFIDIIKKDLLTYRDLFEEPQSMFEALRAVARNKKRSQKHINFNDMIHEKLNGDSNDPDCDLKSPRLIQRDKTKLNRNRVKRMKIPDNLLKQRHLVQNTTNKYNADLSQESEEIDSYRSYKRKKLIPYGHEEIKIKRN